MFSYCSKICSAPYVFSISLFIRDVHWDGKHPPSTGDDIVDKRKIREIRKHGVTRHIICIRHGQYDETHKVREKKERNTLNFDGEC